MSKKSYNKPILKGISIIIIVKIISRFLIKVNNISK